MKVRELWQRLFKTSVQAGEGQRSVDNVDAMTAAAQSQRLDPQGGQPATFPPDYVKPVDEGRPRH